MKPLLLAMLVASCTPAYAAPISRETRAWVMHIADRCGVPRSVADRLHVEESGDWRTGAWGDAGAIGPVGADGFRCRGLYQINPRVEAYLVAKYYPHPARYFDAFDAIDNATVALGYLAALHTRFGNWTQALWYYNAGKSKGVSESTRAYAMRIISAHYHE